MASKTGRPARSGTRERGKAGKLAELRCAIVEARKSGEPVVYDPTAIKQRGRKALSVRKQRSE